MGTSAAPLPILINSAVAAIIEQATIGHNRALWFSVSRA
jgi:hypothetical protein